MINSAYTVETFLEGTRTDPARLAEKMRHGEILLAEDPAGQLIGCIYTELRSVSADSGTGQKCAPRGYLGMLAVDPAHQHLHYGRSLMLAAEDLLRQLLASNRQNHMACEYLLTHYLLTGEFKKLARQVGQLEGFGYTVIHRPVEEALVLGQKLQGLEFELHGLKIQPDTLRRFQSFCDALGEKTGQAPVALAALAPDFGDTFWYYYYTRFNAKTGDGS